MFQKRFFLGAYFLLQQAFSMGLELDLSEAESLALASSTDLRHEREQLSLAVLNRNLTIRAFLPQLDVRYGDSYQRVFHGADSESFSLVFDIRQLLFDGGRSLSSQKLAAVELELYTASLGRSIETVKDDLWRLFHQLLVIGKELGLQRELYDISSEQLKITQRKKELGSITEMDYLDTMMNLRNQEIRILETEIRGKTLKKEFLFLLGLDTRLPDDEEVILLGGINREYPGLLLCPEDLPLFEAMALSRNLDLRKQEAAILQAKTQCHLLKTSFLPTLHLDASVSFSGDALPMQNIGYSVGLSLGFPYDILPLSGSTERSSRGEKARGSGVSGETSLVPDISFVGKRRAAELQLRQELSTLDEMKRKMKHRISSLLETHYQKRLALDLLRQNQELHKRKLEILEARNRLGEVMELALLEGRTEYYDGEISLWESVLDILLCEREMEQLLGLGTGELEYLCGGRQNE